MHNNNNMYNNNNMVYKCIIIIIIIICSTIIVHATMDASTSDTVILSALEQAIKSMEENNADMKIDHNNNNNNNQQRGGEGEECSSLDGPFCSLINYDMFGITQNPYSSGKESSNKYESQIRSSLDKILSALKDKPQGSSNSNNNNGGRKRPRIITATINADATPEEIAEATRKAIRDAGIEGIDHIEQITAAVAADASPEAIAAATQEALRVGVSGEMSDLIAEARQIIMDENGDLTDVNQLLNLDRLVNGATADLISSDNNNNNNNNNDGNTPHRRASTKPTTPQKRLAHELASNEYTPSQSSGQPRDEEILRLDLMDDVRAVQSSVFLNREANLAVDGNTDGDWPGISHTYNQKEAWWQVTLPHVYPISSIRIWNRRDGGSTIRQRLFPFFLLISNSNEFSDIQCPNPSACNSLESAKETALDYKYFSSSASCRVEEGKIDGREMCIWEFEVPINLRHVRVQLEESSHLNLAEVELLISPSRLGQLDDEELDAYHDESRMDEMEQQLMDEMQQTMEILSNGEQNLGMNLGMNGPEGIEGEQYDDDDDEL